MRISLLLCLVLVLSSCSQRSDKEEVKTPSIGFIDYVEDATLAQAREGFVKALSDSGYSEEKNTLHITYRNAQGDQPTLLQAADYLIGKEPALIATNTTLATINTIKRSNKIPVFMMVAPRPDIAGLTDASGKAPANLYGVYETLDYIDTSVTLIRELFPNAKTIGTIFNQAESQSTDALNRLRKGCAAAGLKLVELPVTSSSESQLVTQALLSKNIDVFFALPDNVIFSSFEVIEKECKNKNIPVITSEAGLVARGALASYGADFYQWGYQSGAMAASYLKNPKAAFAPAEVKVRRKLINTSVAKAYNIVIPTNFEQVK